MSEQQERRNTSTLREVDVREVIAPYGVCSCPSQGEEPHDPECVHYFLLGAVHDALVAVRSRLLAYADRYPAGRVQDFQIERVIGGMVDQISEDRATYQPLHEPGSKP